MTYEVGRGSWRAWAWAAAVAVVVAFGVVWPSEPVGSQEGRWTKELGLSDVPGCAEGAPGRSVAGAEGVPRLSIGSFGSYDPGPRVGGSARFTVSAHLDPGPEALRLSGMRAAVDVYAPHGKGRTASARGLAVRVLVEPDIGAPEPDNPEEVRPDARGGYRFTREREVYLSVDLPAGAVCPGHRLTKLNACTPQFTNQIENCPVVQLELTAEGLTSGRLVAVSPQAGDGGAAGGQDGQAV
ncbi:hypothetical protein AB0J38_39245 [Streptomyces sp. NPDC050095]|uniref:hypothetical protein n=1 Tax=unclassified Streptomyces TaxID=2593676 RepID=UPI0034169CB4